MLDKLKNLEFKTVFKYLWFWIIFIIFIAFALWIISFIFSGINSNFFWWKNYSYDNYWWPSFALQSQKWISNSIKENYVWTSNVTSLNESNYEIKSYNVNLESSKVEEDCNKLINLLNKEYTKTDNINISKNYCYLNIKILKWKEQELLTLFNQFKLKDINSNIVNIVKSYSWITDKIIWLKKRVDEIDLLLLESKTNYNELWSSLKNKNISPESIDALNKIIQNKSSLIVQFSNDKQNLLQQIDDLVKQKEEYIEQINYISFYINFTKKVIVDFEEIKDWWYYSYKSLVETFNDTIKNLTVNLFSFLLKAINVIIYIIIWFLFILVWWKLIYKIWKKIIFK